MEMEPSEIAIVPTVQNVADDCGEAGAEPISVGLKDNNSCKKNKHNFARQKNKKWKIKNQPSSSKKFHRREKLKNKDKDEKQQLHVQNPANQSKNKHNKNINSIKNRRLQALSTISKFFLPDKRPRLPIIPPTKFLLGGNISDPLNLNSLKNDSENAVTPKSSPIPTPPHYHKAKKIEVIIPPNINDPLHLLDPVDSVEYELQLCSPMKKKHKPKNKRKRKLNKDAKNASIDSTGTVEDECEPTTIEKVPEDEPGSSKENIDTKPPSREIAVKEKLLKTFKLDLSECGQMLCNRKRKISESTSCSKNKVRRMDSMDKIVSPVIPQPGQWKRVVWPKPGGERIRTKSHSSAIGEEVTRQNSVSEVVVPVEIVTTDETADKEEEHLTARVEEQKEEDKLLESNLCVEAKYHYGNYNRYYGYRQLNEFIDIRLKVFLRNPHLFREKDVLDIGCNVGLMTIAVARMLNTKTIVGIDIDKNLIAKARNNIATYVKIPAESVPALPKNEDDKKNAKKKQYNSNKNQKYHKYKRNHVDFFPISFPVAQGNFSNMENKLDCVEKTDNTFPNNVFFKTMNYVLKDEQLINQDIQQYDLILCLSVTKWIHLNFGDSGLKIAFKRMFNQLRPGGKLILEAQNWASYKKKKKLTETIFANYKEIEFYPNKFHDYLLSPEVGFSHSYPLGIPRHLGKGFKRPIQLYVKGDFTPSQAQWSDTYHPQTPRENTRAIYTDIVTSGGGQRNNCIWGETTPYNISSYSYRYTPLQNFPALSPYYNPMQTDSYLPSYDTVNRRGAYCFSSPLYSTSWSPPAMWPLIEMNRRRSASNTPNSSSFRSAENEEGFSHQGRSQHVYPPIDVFNDDKPASDVSISSSNNTPQ